MDETTLSGETTLSLTCSWCADDVVLGMVYGLKTFCDFRSSTLKYYTHQNVTKKTLELAELPTHVCNAHRVNLKPRERNL